MNTFKKIFTLTIFASLTAQAFPTLQDFYKAESELCKSANSAVIKRYISYEKVVFGEQNTIEGFDSKEIGIRFFVNSTVNLTHSSFYNPSLPPQEIICASAPAKIKYNNKTHQIEITEIEISKTVSYIGHHGNVAPVVTQLAATKTDILPLSVLPLYTFITVKMLGNSEKIYFYNDYKVYLYAAESSLCADTPRKCKDGSIKAIVKDITHIHKDSDIEEPLTLNDPISGARVELKN